MRKAHAVVALLFASGCSRTTATGADGATPASSPSSGASASAVATAPELDADPLPIDPKLEADVLAVTRSRPG